MVSKRKGSILSISKLQCIWRIGDSVECSLVSLVTTETQVICMALHQETIQLAELVQSKLD